ncbi:RND transporter [Chryseobacterium sp. ON_d1]|nr:RND transporter [Chryseobacterium sp. ON_d1]
MKEDLPEQFPDQEAQTLNSGNVKWREFITDPVLVNLIEMALKNNRDLMQVFQEIEIAKSNVLFKKGAMSPTVSMSMGTGVKKSARYTSEGAGNATTDIEPGRKMPDPLPNFGMGLNTSWEVDIWKKLRDGKDAAVSHYLATIEGKNFVLSNLIEQISTQYYDLLALDNRLDIVKQYIQIQEKALSVAKIQKQAAVSTELAVKRFEAELIKSKATLTTLQQEMTEKENGLNALLGRFPQPIPRDKSSLLSTVPQKIGVGIPSELLSNRPDIKRAELELRSSQLNVSVARKEFYPSFTISATLGLAAFKPSYLIKMPESIAYGIIGDLAGPLINKSAIKANFSTANARQLQALYEYDKTILNAYIEVANLMSKVKNIDLYYQMKRNETEVLNQSIDIAGLLFKNSRADYLEILLNQRDVLSARQELIEAKKEQLIAVVHIYKSLGGGWQ